MDTSCIWKHKQEEGDLYCIACGYDLERKLEWTPDVEEANNLHWLAQAQRRLVLPIESTEYIPFLSFEYSWKVLNRLYNSIPIPKVFDPEKGKNRERNAQEKILYLIHHVDATKTIIDRNEARIGKLCDCVLEIPDRNYFTGKRGYVDFDDASPEQAADLRKCAIDQCQTLMDAVLKKDYEEGTTALIKALYSVRNARVHANVFIPEKAPLGGSSESSRRARKASNQKHDYEINTIAELMLSVCKILLAAKTSQPVDHIDDLVISRTSQIAREIYSEVVKWNPS